MKARGEWAYTQEGQIFVPDVRVNAPDASIFEIRALRGCGYVLAVFNRGVCVGYTEACELGFETAKEACKAGVAR
jgi:hypothetical protein